MCGIVGFISSKDITLSLLDSLKKLDYRGYDSAGIALWNGQKIKRRRVAGKVEDLRKFVENQPLEGNIGIGHTRWATHGGVTDLNAHPHGNEEIVLVHNGIIENYVTLKKGLLEKGYTFESETDSEVIVFLLQEALKSHTSCLYALRAVLSQISGAYALAILFKNDPDSLYVVRQGSPIVLGVSETEGLSVASDALALFSKADRFCYLEDGDLAVLSRTDNIKIFDKTGQPIEREWRELSFLQESINKGNYSHYMLKEIFEQPLVLQRTVNSFLQKDTIVFPQALDWKACTGLRIIACGTSYYAGLVAQYWFERYAKIRVQVEVASEFRYRKPVLTPGEWVLVLSQSGETIDTLEALKWISENSPTTTLGIVNVHESSIARAVQHVLYTQAGPEISVASTKAFTTQMILLLLLCLQGAHQRLDRDYQDDLEAIRSLPALIHQVLDQYGHCDSLATPVYQAHDVLFLGRGIHFPIALEGALKLKEISYIHAEGYPGGEMKHGPIALIDTLTPVVFVMPKDSLFEKSFSNLQQVLARGAPVVCLTDVAGLASIPSAIKESLSFKAVLLPAVDELVSPLLYTVIVQLLAYYTALLKGVDIDQPRNLAKSVTVE